MKVRKWLYSIVVIIIVLLCLPYFMGRTAEQELKKSIYVFNHERTSGNLQLKLVSYRRGWFHSKAMLELQAGNGQHVDLPFLIDHGPLILDSKASSVFALADIRNKTYALKQAGLAKFSATLPKSLRETFYVNTHVSISYDGNLHIQMFVPKQSAQQDGISGLWDGLSVNYLYNPGLKYLQGTTRVGAIDVKGAKYGHLIVSPIADESAYQQTKYGLWEVTSKIDVPFVSFKNKDGVSVFSETGLTNTFKTSIKENHLSGAGTLDVKSVVINGYRFGPVHAMSSIKNFASMAVYNLMQTLVQDQRNKVNPQVMLFGLLSDLPKIFLKDTEVSGHMTAKTPQGTFTSNNKFVWPKNHIWTSPNDILLDAQVDGHVSVPVALVNKLLRVVANEQAKINMNADAKPYPAKGKPAVKPQVSYASVAQMQIQQAIAKGYLKVEHGQYVFTLKIRHGNITLNGVPYNPFARPQGQVHDQAGHEATHANFKRPAHGAK